MYVWNVGNLGAMDDGLFPLHFRGIRCSSMCVCDLVVSLTHLLLQLHAVYTYKYIFSVSVSSRNGVNAKMIF